MEICLSKIPTAMCSNIFGFLDRKEVFRVFALNKNICKLLKQKMGIILIAMGFDRQLAMAN